MVLDGPADAFGCARGWCFRRTPRDGV